MYIYWVYINIYVCVCVCVCVPQDRVRAVAFMPSFSLHFLGPTCVAVGVI